MFSCVWQCLPIRERSLTIGGRGGGRGEGGGGEGRVGISSKVRAKKNFSPSQVNSLVTSPVKKKMIFFTNVISLE